MNRKFNYKDISFYVPDGNWFSNIRKPDIHFVYDDNFLEAVRTGNSKVIYEILCEWTQTKEYKDLEKVIEYEACYSSTNDFCTYDDDLTELVGNTFLKEEDKRNILGYLSNCKYSKPIKRPVPGFVYLLQSSDLYKIGKAKDLSKRTSYFTTKMPVEVVLVHSFHSTDHNLAEKQLHQKYAEFRKTGEWFDLSKTQVEEICAIQDDEL